MGIHQGTAPVVVDPYSSTHHGDWRFWGDPPRWVPRRRSGRLGRRGRRVALLGLGIFGEFSEQPTWLQLVSIGAVVVTALGAIAAPIANYRKTGFIKKERAANRDSETTRHSAQPGTIPSYSAPSAGSSNVCATNTPIATVLEPSSRTTWSSCESR